MVIRLSTSVGLHDVYPAMMVLNFRILKESKNDHCLSLWEKKVREILDKKNEKGRKRGRKEKRTIIDHMIGQKKAQNFHVVP